MADKKTKTTKKPLTGYMKFVKEMRSKVVKENPTLTFGGVGKKLGEMWRGLSEAEKKKYSK